MIRHHLSEALLMGYSAGQLPEAFSLIVAAHVSMCDECRARLASYDALGGALLEDDAALPEAPVAAGSLAATMARIKAGRPSERRPEARGIFPAPLVEYVGGGPEAVRWRKAGGGVRQAILPTAGAGIVRLLHIPAGVAVPDHGHQGTELTLVLHGAFRDGTDRFARGDLEIADASLEHTPVAEAGADCICLAATDAPLRFNSLIPRILQPLLKI
jgi:putative transcriptional regulator